MSFERRRAVCISPRHSDVYSAAVEAAGRQLPGIFQREVQVFCCSRQAGVQLQSVTSALQSCCVMMRSTQASLDSDLQALSRLSS